MTSPAAPDDPPFERPREPQRRTPVLLDEAQVRLLLGALDPSRPWPDESLRQDTARLLGFALDRLVQQRMRAAGVPW